VAGLVFSDGQEFVERGVDGVGARGEKLVQVETAGFFGGHKIIPRKCRKRGQGLKGIFFIASVGVFYSK
jgi:hypothetical protein